jgi:hypothetical protein
MAVLAVVAHVAAMAAGERWRGEQKHNQSY